VPPLYLTVRGSAALCLDNLFSVTYLVRPRRRRDSTAYLVILNGRSARSVAHWTKNRPCPLPRASARVMV
jgi:hypothetical protein